MPPVLFFCRKVKRKLKEYLSCWMMIVLMLSPGAFAVPDQPIHLIKSAMIYRMLEYITWPNETTLPTVRVAFVGDEDALYEELLNAAKALKVKGKPLVVFKTAIESIDPSSDQVVYLSQSHSHLLTSVANNIRRTDTLLISTMANNQHDLMINFLSGTGNAVDFEVNRSNIIFEKLIINRDLLLLGGTEIDVAELFRETEVALQQIKLDLFEKESQLKQTNRTLVQEKQQIEQQEQQLAKQQQQITDFKQELTAQEKQLNSRAVKLAKLNQDVQQASFSLQDKQSQLAERERRNNEQLNQLRDQGVKVAFLNEQIAEKQAFLAAQQEQLESLAGKNNEQQGAIVSQKKILVIALTISLVLAALIIFGLWVNASRMRSNQRLQQSQANIVTLAGIGRDLTANLDLNQVMEQIYQSLNKVLDAHIFSLGILRPEENRIHFPLVVEQQQKVPPIDNYLNDTSKPAVWCVTHKKELVINTHQQWLEHFEQPMPEPSHGKKMTTVVYQPLIIGNKIVGCLSLQSPEPNAYSEEQLGMIKTLSRYIAIAVANALGYTELEQQKRKTEAKNREIIAAQQQLTQSEKMASLGMLVAGVAHEINDPASFTHTATFLMEKEIASIKLFLNKLAGSDADPALLQMFEQKFATLIELNLSAQKGSQQIKTIVDNVHAFSDRDELTLQQLPIGQLIGSTVQLLKTQHSHIKISTPSELSNACYPAKLGQVFMNLTMNACQAIEKKKQHQPQMHGLIEITSIKTTDQLTIQVKDNGCGMTAETQSKIFEPFYSTAQNSSGLGMSTSLGIVKELGGTLDVQSSPDSGTVLSVCLPMTPC